MTKSSTMSKDSEAPLARHISRAKGQVAKPAPLKPVTAASPKPHPGSGIAGAVASMDDETREELQAALGTKNVSFNTNLFVRTSRTAFAFHGDGIHAGAEDALNQTATLVAIKAFKPTDPVEAMIAAQAIMLHNLAMEAGRRAQLPQQNSDTASRLRKDAANGARCMTDMVDALARYRGKGTHQVIRVEKMLVADGGQAVVGNVTSGTPSVTSPLPRQGITQGARPLATGDALPVIAGDVRGEGER